MISETSIRIFTVCAFGVGVGGFVLAFWAYLADISTRASQADVGKACCSPRSMGYFVAKNVGKWAYIRGGSVKVPRVPVLRNIIRAGDWGFFSSAMFNDIPPGPQAVCWVKLYTAYFDEMMWTSQCDNRLDSKADDPDIGRYIQQATKTIRQEMKRWEHSGRSKLRMKVPKIASLFRKDLQKEDRLELQTNITSARHENPFVSTAAAPPVETRRAQDDEEALILRNPIPVASFSPLEPGPSRHYLFFVDPVSKKAPALVSSVKKLDYYQIYSLSKAPPYIDLKKELRSLWILDGTPCVEVSRRELLGLALAMGMTLRLERASSIYGTGPFGSHMCIRVDGIHSRVYIGHVQRGSPKGSGYSLIHARYMACETLPFGQSDGRFFGYFHLIHITQKVLDGIVNGKSINWKDPAIDPLPLKFVRRLHCSRLPYIYGDTESTNTSQEYTEKTPQPQILFNPENAKFLNKTASWPEAVAGIAFGGLVPQAGAKLIKAVVFTVSGNLLSDRTAEWKESLYHYLEVLMNHLQINDPSLRLFGPAVALRVFDVHGRNDISYRTSMTDEDGYLSAATAGERFARYTTILERLMALSWKHSPSSKTIMEKVYQKTCDLVTAAYHNAVQKDGEPCNFIQDVVDVIGKVEKEKDMDMDIESTSKIAVCLIAAWAYQVHKVDEKVYTLSRSHHNGRTPIGQVAAWHDLPLVAALG